jgi:hypothetical protein
LVLFSTTHCTLKAYCAFLVRHSIFRRQASPRESTQRRNVKLWARKVQQFCLNAEFQFTFGDLLHAVKLRRLYIPSEGSRAEDSFAPWIPTASEGCEPANLGTKGQHATSRPPKPLSVHLRVL